MNDILERIHRAKGSAPLCVQCGERPQRHHGYCSRCAMELTDPIWSGAEVVWLNARLDEVKRLLAPIAKAAANIPPWAEGSTPLAVMYRIDEQTPPKSYELGSITVGTLHRAAELMQRLEDET